MKAFRVTAIPMATTDKLEVGLLLYTFMEIPD
jgi:hypothetical protein